MIPAAFTSSRPSSIGGANPMVGRIVGAVDRIGRDPRSSALMFKWSSMTPKVSPGFPGVIPTMKGKV